MECIFYEKNTCLANRHYHFLRGILIDKMKLVNVDPQKIHFELYTKYTKKVNGSKHGHLNGIPILLCVTEMVCSLVPDRRYTGFCCANGKMINQLDAYK